MVGESELTGKRELAWMTARQSLGVCNSYILLQCGRMQPIRNRQHDSALF